MQELEIDVGIPKTPLFNILTQDLGMKRAMANFIPLLLLPEQKEHLAVIANGLIQTTTNKRDFLNMVITLMGTEASFSYVQCFLYLVSSSINVSIFYIMGMDTFWTDVVLKTFL